MSSKGKLGFIYILCCLFFNVGFSNIKAQDKDSIYFVNTKWSKKRLAAGVKLFHYTYSRGQLFGAAENISFVKVKPGFFTIAKFGFDAEPKTLKPLSSFVEGKRKMIAAINGNFFNMKDGGAVGFIKVNGNVVNPNQKGKNDKLLFHQKAAVAIENGKLEILKWNGKDDWAENLHQTNVMVNGPLLIMDHKPEPIDSISFNANRHPRTALGILPDGAVLMLVVDGRNSNSQGMSLFELTKVMRWLGCKSAINFDGGGSSTLWINKGGIFNYPSDNKKWDHEGERKIANILFIKKGK